VTDGADKNIELVNQQNVVSLLFDFLNSAQDLLITPALRVLGNFATGNDELTQVLDTILVPVKFNRTDFKVVIDSGVLSQAIPQLMLSNNNTFVKESCWLISNVLAGNSQQIQV
jgi:hypothetical protein